MEVYLVLRRRPVVAEITVSRVVVANWKVVPNLLIEAVTLEMKADGLYETSDT